MKNMKKGNESSLFDSIMNAVFWVGIVLILAHNIICEICN